MFKWFRNEYTRQLEGYRFRMELGCLEQEHDGIERTTWRARCCAACNAAVQPVRDLWQEVAPAVQIIGWIMAVLMLLLVAPKLPGVLIGFVGLMGGF